VCVCVCVCVCVSMRTFRVISDRRDSTRQFLVDDCLYNAKTTALKILHKTNNARYNRTLRRKS